MYKRSPAGYQTPPTPKRVRYSNVATDQPVVYMAPPQPQFQPVAQAMNRRGVASKETGFVDTAGAAYNFDTTGSIAHISVIPQGSSVNQRIGKKVVLKSIQCRGAFVNNSTAVYNDVALLLIYDRRPTGSLPSVTDVLNTASAQSFNNDANSGRFQILKRIDCEMIGNPTLITDKYAMSADFFLDLKSKPWVAKAVGSGAIGDVEEGALYVLTVGNNAAGTTAATAGLGFRLRFVDV